MILTQRCCLCGDLATDEHDGEYFCSRHSMLMINDDFERSGKSPGTSPI